MKRLALLLALLLAGTCILSACASTETTGTTTATSPDGEKNDPTDENDSDTDLSAVGIWFSNAANAAIEFTPDSNASKFYSCTWGYYEYYAVQDATYTYDQEEGTLVLTLEGTDYTFSYHTSDDTLVLITDSGETVYERQDARPEEHPNYSFPKYRDMDFSEVLTLPDYKTFDLWDEAVAQARLEIFSSHFSDGLRKPGTVTDRPVTFGDLVLIDYVGKKDGIAFSGGTGSNYELEIIGQSSFIPGFAEGIIGHMAGEEFEISVTFPENYHAQDLAGQPVIFEITLHTVYDVYLTDEQFAEHQTPYATYEEWVTGVAKEKIGNIMMNKIFSEVKVNGEIPSETYMYFYQSSIDYDHYMAYYYHMTYEQYCKIFGNNSEKYMSQAKSYALSYMICHQIAKNESLTWTDTQYSNKFEAYVKKLTDNGYSYDDAVAYVGNNQMDNLYADLTVDAVRAYFQNSVQ